MRTILPAWQTSSIRLIATLLAVCTLALCADSPADLTLKDSTGHKVRLRDFRGKPVLLNFWATWCVPCNDEMPALVSLEKQYVGRVTFIGASLDDSKTEAKIPAFLDRHQVGFAIWHGATLDDMDRLKIGDAVPATVFLDAEGHIVARILGQARPEEVKERLEWLTGGGAGQPPEALVKHLDK